MFAAMGLALLSAQGRAQAHTQAPATLRVLCADSRSLSLRIEEKRAIASFEGRRMVLPRIAFPLGAYYRSSEGALVIDGLFVAFVPSGDPNWRRCEIQPRR